MALLAQFPFSAFEETAYGLSTSISSSLWTEDLRYGLLELKNLIPFSFEIEQKEDENWNAIWEASFKEILIGNFCQIRASFHAVNQSVDYSITIEPRMAFGTGHHETTRLVIKALQRISIKGETVIDYGAGTGILAMLASKMGAAAISAVECDPIAFENLKENMRSNDTTHVECQLSDRIDSSSQSNVGLVLANITRNILLQNLRMIFQVLRPGGIAVLSGFLQGDRKSMEEAIYRFGGTVESVLTENNWLALICKKTI